jgi:hypothetical protein
MGGVTKIQDELPMDGERHEPTNPRVPTTIQINGEIFVNMTESTRLRIIAAKCVRVFTSHASLFVDAV